MASEVASAYVSLVPSARGFGRALDRQIRPDVDRSGRTSGSRFATAFTASSSGRIRAGFSGIARGAAAGIAAAGAGAALGLKSAVTAASDLGETTSKVAQIFGREALPALQQFADGAAASLGQSKQSALDAAATFATFGKSAGLTGSALSGFSTRLVTLSSDMASFGNTTPEEAIQAIGSALRGETEPIRRYGVLLDDASLRQEALAQGLIRTTKQALTPQQRVLAAQALILKQTSDAQGDFARTSGGLANQQRILTANLNNLKASLGQALLPAATAATKALSGFITQMQAGQGAGGRFAEAMTIVSDVARGAFDIFKTSVLPTLRSVGGFITGSLVPALRGAFADYLPKARAAFESIAGTIRDNQGVFRALGQILTQVVIPVVGEVAGLLVSTLGPAFKGIAYVLKQVVIPAFSITTQAVLTAFKGILKAAAWAFGWIPEIGPKLKTASAQFATFVDETNAKLRNIERSVDVKVNIQPVVHPPISETIHAKNFIGPTLAEAKSAKGIAGPYSPRDRGETQVKETTRKMAAIARQSTAQVKSAFGALGETAATSLADGIESKKKAATDKAARLASEIVDKAKRALADARQQLRDYAAGVADSIRNFGSITSIGQTGAAATPNSIQRFLRTQLDAITAFQRNLKALAKRGISNSLLRQIADAGVETGGPVAAALVRASGKQFATITDLDRRIGGTASAIGNLAAQRIHGAGVQKAIENVNITVNNPLPERASTSVPKAVRRALLAAG